MDEVELVKALVSPAEKLIDAVSGAIGKAYEPHHIRKMADAKAYELRQISEAVRTNSDIPIVYDSTGVSIDTSNFEEIAKRASSRLAFQEITKQQNIEAVADKAYEELKASEAVTDKPVNPDWMCRFFNSVENISNEEMQTIWAHILAGEVKEPDTYSYRTLEKLKNMTQQEALIFQRVAEFAIAAGESYFLLQNTDIFSKYGIKFSDFLTLQECGLFSVQTLELTLTVDMNEPIAIYNKNIVGLLYGKKAEPSNLKISCFVFTESGIQLLKGIGNPCNSGYLIDCIKWIREHHPECIISAHKIHWIDSNGQINYNKEDLLPTIEIQ